jgi:signal transduction histidine kinase
MSLIGWARRQPLPRTLTLMTLLVSGVAVITACAAFAVYDAFVFRDGLAQNLAVQARIVAAQSVTPLLFDDQDAADRTLQLLAGSPEVVGAEIRRPDGTPFAIFRRDAAPLPGPPAIASGTDEARDVSFSSIGVVRAVIVDGRAIGSVHLRGNLEGLYQRLGRFALLVLLVQLIALGITLPVAFYVQRSISRPLIALAATAQAVSDRQDYSLRAEVGGAGPELTGMATTFNTMLATVEERNWQLSASHAELDARVQQRTAELQATNDELEAFSYSVSHDLRAPLRHITGFASMLQRHSAGALDAKGHRYVQTMIDSAAQMGRLIDDLLAFSRIGRSSMSVGRVALTPLVEGARGEVARDAGGRSIAWRIDPLPEVAGDAALLRLVFINLLSNAVKYTGQREQACITVSEVPAESPGEVVVAVRDNGVGFDMQYVHKLFGVFQRLHSAQEFTGTGIGLANVRRIVTRHGGRVWAEGRLDEGATFHVALPRWSPEEKR